MIAVRFKKRGHQPSLAMLALSSLMVLAPLFAACGGSGTSLAAPTDLLTSGVLTVGSDTSYPPQEYIDPTTKKATGFDIDLITEMAKLMGLQARIVPTKFETLLDDLVARRFDIVISAVTTTSERQKKVDFVPYLSVGESFQ